MKHILLPLYFVSVFVNVFVNAYWCTILRRKFIFTEIVKGESVKTWFTFLKHYSLAWYGEDIFLISPQKHVLWVLIKMSHWDTSNEYLHFFLEEMCCGYPLEACHSDATDEYPQLNFCGEIRKISNFGWKKWLISSVVILWSHSSW